MIKYNINNSTLIKKLKKIAKTFFKQIKKEVNFLLNLGNYKHCMFG